MKSLLKSKVHLSLSYTTIKIVNVKYLQFLIIQKYDIMTMYS